MRRKTNLVPRMEKCMHLLVSQPEAFHGVWLQSSGYKDLHLELGCGKGLFIAETAKNYPDVLYIALEKTANVIVSALELAMRENINNVRYINGPAERLREFFAPGEVSRIYINFCDPWPSNRHRNRRLTGSAFLQIYKEVLSNGGEIHFKTDSRALFDFSRREFERAGFITTIAKENIHEHGAAGIMTEYERKFVSQGVPVYQLICISPPETENTENG